MLHITMVLVIVVVRCESSAAVKHACRAMHARTFLSMQYLQVYNVTDCLEEHPGGYDIILTSAGEAGGD